jgi:transposase InsO family protein
VPECLLFLSLADAQEKMEDWRKYYNEERPYGAIGQKAPITLLGCDGVDGPPSDRRRKLYPSAVQSSVLEH